MNGPFRKHAEQGVDTGRFVCEGMKPGDVLMLERQVVEIVRRTVLPSLESRVLTMVEGVERLRRFRFAAEEEVEGCEICEY